MLIESDEEFISLMRARFSTKPYTQPGELYWTDAQYEQLIADLLVTQQTIRAAATAPTQKEDSLSSDAWDAKTAQWAIWSIQTHDVGATPTHWHRVWSAIQSVIASTRYDERRRIAAALRADNASMLGPTAAQLIESCIASEVSD
jgi:hypothetical protein